MFPYYSRVRVRVQVLHSACGHPGRGRGTSLLLVRGGISPGFLRWEGEMYFNTAPQVASIWGGSFFFFDHWMILKVPASHSASSERGGERPPHYQGVGGKSRIPMWSPLLTVCL